MTMKNTHSALILTVALVATTGTAGATQLGNSGFDLSSNVAVTTDYTFRGISQTNEGPALQGGFDLSHESGFYVGNWNSNVEFGDASLESDIYGGWAGSFNDVSVDVGAVYFFYPDTGADGSDDEFDYGEVYGTLGYDFGFASVSAGVDLTNEFFAESGDAQHYRGSISVPITDVVSLGANTGYQVIDENDTFGTPDYWHYGVSVSASFAENYTATLSGVGNDLDDGECFGGSDLCDERVEFMLSASF
jgi:uncharacterized protein (TIGR02001 family)